VIILNENNIEKGCGWYIEFILSANVRNKIDYSATKIEKINVG